MHDGPTHLPTHLPHPPHPFKNTLVTRTTGPATQEAVRAALTADDAQSPQATHQDAHDVRQLTDMVQRVPWTIPDSVVLQRCAPVDAGRAVLPVTFLMIVGMGGVQSRRGVDIALRAFHLAMQEGGEEANLQLLLSTTLYPFPVEPHLLDHPNVTVLYQVCVWFVVLRHRKVTVSCIRCV